MGVSRHWSWWSPSLWHGEQDLKLLRFAKASNSSGFHKELGRKGQDYAQGLSTLENS